MNKLKVGIVGCGFVAKKRHIPGFLRLKKNVTLSAVCDLNQELAKDAAKQFGIPHVYSDLSEMLSKEQLDIVDVCTPPKIHAPVALEAMENGCNVLLEKPMAPSLNDCDKMVEASRKYGVKLSVVHNQNFYPPFLKAQKLVESGAIGKLLGMRVLILTTRDEYIAHENHWIHKLPGGAIGETGPHAVYMSLAFLDNVTDVNVCARKQSDYPWVSYDDYRIELVGENITSSILVSHAGDCNASTVDLFGTDGTINIDLQSMLLTRYRRKHLKPTSVASSSLSVAGQTINGVVSNVFRVCLGKSMLGHDIMIKKFVESIIHNQPVPVTPEEGRETIRVMETIVRKLEHALRV
ncbi:MAG: gfo/Idh/MocA family oxidoreductase [Dehalococcoidia bacterium]|nr:MAG: gfo/Idh/MocA family oxidoreductase [Dehalococcoidia bacterium]